MHSVTEADDCTRCVQQCGGNSNNSASETEQNERLVNDIFKLSACKFVPLGEVQMRARVETAKY